MAWVINTILVLLVLSTNEVVMGEEPLVVQTSTGEVRGITQTVANGMSVDAWYGIPYAQPPIGDLRFRHPQPIRKWTNVKNADIPPNSCIQIRDDFFGHFEGATMWNPNTEMSEDCLYLSIIVPKPRPQNAPVMIWIYGGGFYSGTSTLEVYDYKMLASEQNVIVAAIQYRVASLGFLYFGARGVNGNAGLFDQLMALQWIRNNIEYFGGSKDNITLFGESAGAASIGMHLLSPLSRHLFNRAIMQSGAASDRITLTKEESLSRGLRLAEAVDCPHTREELNETISCLRFINASDLVYNEPFQPQVVGSNSFRPIIDGAFLDAFPSELIKLGNFKHTSIMMGGNSEEGNYFLFYYLPEFFQRAENNYITREEFEKIVNEIHPHRSEIEKQAIMYEYTNWLNPDDGRMNSDAIDKMVGDYYFTCNVNEFAHQYALSGNNVYKYYFNHRSSQNPWPRWTGVMHGDEINYVFGEPLNPKLRYTDEERELSKKMMTYWANFAKTGNPSVGVDGRFTHQNWPIHTVSGKDYLTLNTSNYASPGHGLRLKKCAFWKKFIPQLLKYTDAVSVATSTPNPKNYSEERKDNTKYALPETEETKDLTTTQLQRLVLLEQLKLARLQQKIILSNREMDK